MRQKRWCRHSPGPRVIILRQSTIYTYLTCLTFCIVILFHFSSISVAFFFCIPYLSKPEPGAGEGFLWKIKSWISPDVQMPIKHFCSNLKHVSITCLSNEVFTNSSLFTNRNGMLLSIYLILSQKIGWYHISVSLWTLHSKAKRKRIWNQFFVLSR